MNIFGLFDKPIKFANQDYFALKKECQTCFKHFEDPIFPPTISSLFTTNNHDINVSKIIWKRPPQICKRPFLFVEGVSSNDVHQGRLGNCWYVAACACITVYKENWTKVIPDYKSQEWDENNPSNYVGIFRFRFWRFGYWYEVVIDDLLPTIGNELLFCHSKFRNEYWSALLEKAYAKFMGSYEALEGGELAESLVDFTGGIAEPLQLSDELRMSEPKNKLFQTLQEEHANKSLMAAAIPAKTPDEIEKETKHGLFIGHAYAITHVRAITLSIDLPLFDKYKDYKNKLRMIRLRNPWGQGEWKGAFSDGSAEWEALHRNSLKRIGLTFEDDGEFWMTFEDFMKCFQSLVICRQMNTSILSIRKTWFESIFHGEWRPECSGGCLNFRATFLMNPQYVFDVTPANGDEVHFFLTQKMTRELRRQDGATGLMHIGFTILRVEVNRTFRVHNLNHVVIEQSSSYKNGRSIFMKHFLKRGRYVVIPTTYQPSTVQDFLLRIYTSRSNEARHLNIELPKIQPSVMSFFFNKKVVATRFTIFKAADLSRVDLSRGANPYCIVQCEGQEASTSVCEATMDPIWNESFIFLRRNPNKEHIVLTIMSRNAVFDDFLGRQVFNIELEKKFGNLIETDLLDREDFKSGESRRSGTLFVKMQTFSEKDLSIL